VRQPRGTKTGQGFDTPALAALEPTDRRLARLDARHVLGLHLLPALCRLVGDLGALFQALEAVADYACVVHEEVLAPWSGEMKP
jgi:hypothetical protein